MAKQIEIIKYDVLGKLPPLLRLEDGTPVDNSKLWQKRRHEIYQTAVELQYGTIPPAPQVFNTEILYKSKNKISCLITAGTAEKQLSFHMNILLPVTNNPVPIIIDGDTCFEYYLTPGFIDTALNRGIGWILFDRTQIAPDLQEHGRQGFLYDIYPEYTFGALAAWAWGYSRCIDALLELKLPEIDTDTIAFTGHSRGGKTAALAGVLDSRCTITNPNATCAGSCSCYRIHMEGKCGDIQGPSEDLRHLWEHFDFWIGPEMQKYINSEEQLPFDCHFLKAMIAPRKVFFSEAAADFWSNPVGAWQTTQAAKEVYKLLGAEENILWYYRDGTHNHTVQDVEMLCEIILNHIDPKHPLPAGLFDAPFQLPDPIW